MSDDILTRPGQAFPNGTEWEQWFENWCARCVHDAATRRDDWAEGCPLIPVALCVMARTRFRGLQRPITTLQRGEETR